MANENGTGYQLLELKIQNLEDKLKDIKKEIKDNNKDVVVKFNDHDKKFDELHDRVDDLEKTIGRIEYMFDSMTKNHTEMKTDIKTIAASAGKDQGWRALLTDIIKIAGIILTFILTGKWIG